MRVFFRTANTSIDRVHIVPDATPIIYKAQIYEISANFTSLLKVRSFIFKLISTESTEYVHCQYN